MMVDGTDERTDDTGEHGADTGEEPQPRATQGMVLDMMRELLYQRRVVARKLYLQSMRTSHGLTREPHEERCKRLATDANVAATTYVHTTVRFDHALIAALGTDLMETFKTISVRLLDDVAATGLPDDGGQRTVVIRGEDLMRMMTGGDDYPHPNTDDDPDDTESMYDEYDPDV